MIKELEIFSGSFETILELPFANERVWGGFPGPTQDYMNKSLDFNKKLISHPAATFYAIETGESMINAGISVGDIVVIDRAMEPKHNDIVVAFINSEFTMKYLDLSYRDCGNIRLRLGYDSYPSFCITEGKQFSIWGVVTKDIKNFR